MHRSGTPTTVRRATGVIAGVVAGLLVVLGLGTPAVAASSGAALTRHVTTGPLAGHVDVHDAGHVAGSPRGSTAEHASAGHVAVASGTHRKPAPVPGGAADPVDGARVPGRQPGRVVSTVRPSAPRAAGVDRTAHGRAPPA